MTLELQTLFYHITNMQEDLLTALDALNLRYVDLQETTLGVTHYRTKETFFEIEYLEKMVSDLIQNLNCCHKLKAAFCRFSVMESDQVILLNGIYTNTLNNAYKVK